jgi:probable HAF family extracellular repeat protein
MQQRTSIHLVALLFFAFALSPSTPAADQAVDLLHFSEAASINNRGVIAGGGCTSLCLTYEAVRVVANRLTFLGTLGGFAAVGYAINNGGVIAGQADTSQTDPNGVTISLAFVVHGDNPLRALGTLPGYAHSQAFGINDHNEVVGWVYNTDLTRPGGVAQDFRGFHVGADRVMRDVGSLGGATIARAIDNLGTIVGSSRLPDGQTRAFVLARGTMTALRGLGGRFAEATGLNERGQIVGSATYAGSNERRAVLWDRGVIIDLGTLGGSGARAWQINSRSDIVGEARTANGDRHAFLYYEGLIRDLGTLGGSISAALDINDEREIVGISETGEVDPLFGPVTRGFIVGKDGAMRDIRTLIARQD